MPRSSGSERPMASKESMASTTVPVMSPSATGVCWSGVAMLCWSCGKVTWGCRLKGAPKVALVLF
jgi:hypothetical protein